MCRKTKFRESCDHSSAILPNQPGTYAVILHVPRMKKISIGVLGEWMIETGYYAYIGSAFGPGGLRGRLGHHVQSRGHAKAHWHIDYLRSIAEIDEIWWTDDAIKREHGWAFIFHEQMDTETPIKGFGSSDCACVSHLFYSHRKPNIRRFSRLAHSHWKDHLRIHLAVHFEG